MPSQTSYSATSDETDTLNPPPQGPGLVPVPNPACRPQRAVCSEYLWLSHNSRKRPERIHDPSAKQTEQGRVGWDWAGYSGEERRRGREKLSHHHREPRHPSSQAPPHELHRSVRWSHCRAKGLSGQLLSRGRT